MKKICFIAGTLGRGGAERQLYYIVKLLCQQGLNVCVIVLTRGEYYEHLIQEAGAVVVHVKRSENRLERLIQIIREVKRFKPEVVYSFHFYSNTYAAISGLLTGVRSYGSIRSDGNSEKRENGVFSWLHYTLPNNMVANSSHGAANANRIFFRRKIAVLPNIVDNHIFQYCEKEQLSDPVKLLFIGRMTRVKRPQLFIELVRNLLNRGVKVEARMIGKGNNWENMKKLASGLPVQFDGDVDNVVPVYHWADFMISTSEHEGTPNVFLESFSCGTPVIALDHEGIGEWNQKKLLYMAKSINEIEDYIANYDHYFIRGQIRKAREYIKTHHSFEYISTSISAILEA